MYKLVIAVALTILASCAEPAGKQVNEEAKLFDNNTTAQAIAVPGGYGYTIQLNGKAIIRQENIPVLQGHQVFRHPEDAEKVGNWVASRIRHNEPFSLTDSVLNMLVKIDSSSIASN